MSFPKTFYKAGIGGLNVVEFTLVAENCPKEYYAVYMNGETKKPERIHATDITEINLSKQITLKMMLQSAEFVVNRINEQINSLNETKQ